MSDQTLTYLRRGRQKRNTGTVLIANDPSGNVKVKPTQDAWKAVWLSPQEIAAGSGKSARKAKPAQSEAMPRPKRIPPSPQWRLTKIRNRAGKFPARKVEIKQGSTAPPVRIARADLDAWLLSQPITNAQP